MVTKTRVIDFESSYIKENYIVLNFHFLLDLSAKAPNKINQTSNDYFLRF